MKQLVAFLLLFIVVACIFVIPTGYCEEINPVVLLNGTLIDGTGADPVSDAVIVIERDRIASIGTANNVEIPDNATKIQLRGATLLPGLINAHVHRAYNRQNLQAWAHAGVTTVRDMASTDMDAQWFEERDALLRDPQNARLVAVGPFLTTPDGYPIQPWKSGAVTVTSPEEAAQKAEELLQQGADLLKIAIENGITFGMRLPILPTEDAAAIVVVAHEHGTKVSSHTTHSADLVSLLNAGVDDIAHMVTDDLSHDLIAAVIHQDVYWVPTLELWHHVQQYLRSRQSEFTPHTHAVENLRKFVEAGGKVALGTDYDGFDAVFDLGTPMLEITSMQEAGMTPMQILVAATKNAAHVCNLEHELGTLEVGKIADILVVGRSPLEDLRALQDVRLVMHNGVVIRDER